MKRSAEKIDGEISTVARETESIADTLCASLVKGLHIAAPFATGAAIVWSAVVAFIDMVGARRTTI